MVALQSARRTIAGCGGEGTSRWRDDNRVSRRDAQPLETPCRTSLTKAAGDSKNCHFAAGIPYRTVHRWTSRYRRFGLAGLAPKPREDRGKRRALSAQLLERTEALALESPRIPVAAIRRRVCQVAEDIGRIFPSYDFVYEVVRRVQENRFGGKDIWDDNTKRGVRYVAGGMIGFLEPSRWRRWR
jgi:hypothetical protein